MQDEAVFQTLCALSVIDDLMDAVDDAGHGAAQLQEECPEHLDAQTV
ncbi:hypothetical protein ACWCOW_29230 [Streptomyces sp. NPDC001939]